MAHFVQILWPELLRSCWEVVEKLSRSCRGKREGEREAKTLPYPRSCRQVVEFLRNCRRRKTKSFRFPEIYPELTLIEASWPNHAPNLSAIDVLWLQRQNRRSFWNQSTQNKNISTQNEPTIARASQILMEDHPTNLSAIDGLRLQRQNRRSFRNHSKQKSNISTHNESTTEIPWATHVRTWTKIHFSQISKTLLNTTRNRTRGT